MKWENIIKKGKRTDRYGRRGRDRRRPVDTPFNPFADKATIKSKIKNEIQKSIDSTKKIKTKEAVIKCDFGMEVNGIVLHVDY